MLTDAQILACFVSGLTDHNGQRCCRVLTENGIASTRRTCQGHTKVQNGKVTLHDTCGEPCSFICQDAQDFHNAVVLLQCYDEIIERAKRGK